MTQVSITEQELRCPAAIYIYKSDDREAHNAPSEAKAAKNGFIVVPDTPELYSW